MILNKRTAAQTAVLMAILTLISKCFGFVREIVTAGFFGTSYITDAYVMAIAIPGIIFGGIFGAMATAYMPLYSKISENEGEEKAIRYTSELINILIFVSCISSLIGLLFSDQIVSIFASGFKGETAHLTSIFVKITFSYVLFSSITRILEAFLRYHNIFLLPIITGYVQNIIVILFIVIGFYYNYYFLIFGWLAAYICKLVITIIFARKIGYKYQVTARLKNTALQILSLTLPVFIGSSFDQINVFINKTLASGLKEGSVSALNYANLLIWMIIGLSISIIMTVLYPKMTRAYATNDMKYFNEIIGRAFNIILIIAIPSSMGAMLYSNQIVQIVYERGAFDSASTILTETAFFYYSIGIVFMSLNMLAVQIYYSMHNMKTPVTCAATGVIINIALNIILVNYLEHGGLALATSISAAFTSGLLYYNLTRKYPDLKIAESFKKPRTIIILAVITLGCSYSLYLGITHSIWMPRMILMGLVVIIAAVIYLALLRIFKFEELDVLKDMLLKHNNK